MTPAPSTVKASWAGVRRLLAIRLDNVGDVLMTTPALAALRAGLPDARITLLASTGGAMAAPHLREVDEVIAFDAPWMACGRESPATVALHGLTQRLSAASFDAAIVFTVCTQSALPAAMLALQAGIPLRLAHCRENPYALLTDWVRDEETPAPGMRHEVQRQLDLVASIGLGTGTHALRFLLDAGDRARAAARLRAAGLPDGARYFVVHPGASAASRRYPAERFAEAAAAVARASGSVPVVVGGPSEAALVAAVCGAPGAPPAVALVGGLTLGELGALIAGADVTLCNNSAPSHLAAAVGGRVVVLYALTNPQHTPWQARARVLNHEVPCRDCLRSECPAGHHDCLRGVPSAAVARAALALMHES